MAAPYQSPDARLTRRYYRRRPIAGLPNRFRGRPTPNIDATVASRVSLPSGQSTASPRTSDTRPCAASVELRTSTNAPAGDARRLRKARRRPYWVVAGPRTTLVALLRGSVALRTPSALSPTRVVGLRTPDIAPPQVTAGPRTTSHRIGTTSHSIGTSRCPNLARRPSKRDRSPRDRERATNQPRTRDQLASNTTHRTGRRCRPAPNSGRPAPNTGRPAPNSGRLTAYTRTAHRYLDSSNPEHQSESLA